jgi:hypothetical protein
MPSTNDLKAGCSPSVAGRAVLSLQPGDWNQQQQSELKARELEPAALKSVIVRVRDRHGAEVGPLRATQLTEVSSYMKRLV